MKIQNYCHYGCKDDTQSGSIVGNPDIALLVHWNKWRDFVMSPEIGRISFIDVPSETEDCRILIFAVNNTKTAVVAFSVSNAVIPFDSAYFLTVFRAIQQIDAPALLKAVAERTAFEFPVENCPFERPPLPPDIKELHGLQLIGNTEKSVNTVSRMIPENVSPDQFKRIVFAVNPIAYSNEFTTIISEETPEGDWDKFPSRQRKKLTSRIQVRRREMIRRRFAPYIFVWILLTGFFFIGLVSALVFGFFAQKNSKEQIQRLTRSNEEYRFSIEKLTRRVDELQFENATQKGIIRSMETNQQGK